MQKKKHLCEQMLVLWRKCFKLNLQRSRAKSELCHNGCWHPERTNELFHLMNESVLDVLGTMPTSCSSVTHVLTPPKELCAAAKLGASLASQLPPQGTASAPGGNRHLTQQYPAGCDLSVCESLSFCKPESLGRETTLPALISSAEESSVN